MKPKDTGGKVTPENTEYDPKTISLHEKREVLPEKDVVHPAFKKARIQDGTFYYKFPVPEKVAKKVEPWMTLIHGKYGKGVIIKVIGDGIPTKIDVKFKTDAGWNKKILSLKSEI